MDDYSVSSLTESQNEWCARLVHILTPLIMDGFKSIFEESWKLCKDNDELDKYLMTFQNFITRIPKWNTDLIQSEKSRIIEKSNCGYLEDLVTCVHIIKLKTLTCVRVGQKQKKININVPSLENFIHRIYINAARKIYTNVYLFEKNIPPLSVQKNNRELETIVKEAILISIRENIPVESILRAYLDETQETNVEVEEHIEEIIQEVEKDITDKSEDVTESEVQQEVHQEGGSEVKPSISFNDVPEINSFVPTPHEPLNIGVDESHEDEESDTIKIGNDVELDDIFDMSSSTSASTLKINDSPIDLGIEILT